MDRCTGSVQHHPMLVSRSSSAWDDQTQHGWADLPHTSILPHDAVTPGMVALYIVGNSTMRDDAYGHPHGAGEHGVTPEEYTPVFTLHTCSAEIR